MTWLWTDTLAALLVEHDRVAPARVVHWVERPVAYRLADEGVPLDLARVLFAGDGPEVTGPGWFSPSERERAATGGGPA